MNKKILIVGGHMAPALGFLLAVPKDIAVVYVGRKHPFEGDLGTSLEFETITRLKIPFIKLQTGRLQRKFTSHTLPSLLRIPRGFLQALHILQTEKPDIVVAFGGYLSVPIGFAARLLGIPLILHESTFGAGLANRMLSSFAQKICISSDSSKAFFPSEKTTITGNPLLPFKTKGAEVYLPKSEESLPLVVIAGGSAGSHAINEIVRKSLPELLSFTRVIHQAGDAREFHDFEKLQETVSTLDKKKQDRYQVVKYIEPEKINTIFHQADLIISRAGFNTVITLLIMKKKAIVIPLPSGQKNEQQENAKLFENSGYGTVLQQDGLTTKELIDVVEQLLKKRTTDLPHFSIPLYSNGAENLVKEVLLCLRHRTDD